MHEGCVATGFTERCVYMYIYYVYNKLLASYGDTQLYCRRPGYAPSKTLLTDKKAIEAFEKALQATNIYRNAASYYRVRSNLRVYLCT